MKPMNRDKQIEEMRCLIGFAKEECRRKCYGKKCTDCDLFALQIMDCENQYIAKALYNAGYRKASDVAKEIFAELQQEIKLALDSNYKARMEHLNKYPDTDNEHLSMLSGKISALRGIDDFIDELEKKYESESTNES